MKYCECGCGNLAPLAKQTKRSIGHIKGQPIRFIYGHHLKNERGNKHWNWQGGKRHHSTGILIFNPNYPHAQKKGYVLEHILKAEQILGKPLPPKAVIHHFKKIKTDNNSIVICQNQAYHLLLHQRERALKASGHANWRKCQYCKNYNVQIDDSHNYHKSCKAKYDHERWLKRTEKNNASTKL